MMERKTGMVGIRRSRLLYWQQEHATNAEELLQTARRLHDAVEALETEIKKTGLDIREVQRSAKRFKEKERRSA
jgi:hypothetical protein